MCKRLIGHLRAIVVFLLCGLIVQQLAEADF